MAKVALSRDHTQMFVEMSPHVWVNDFVRRGKGRSSCRIQQEVECIVRVHVPSAFALT